MGVALLGLFALEGRSQAQQAAYRITAGLTDPGVTSAAFPRFWGELDSTDGREALADPEDWFNGTNNHTFTTHVSAKLGVKRVNRTRPNSIDKVAEPIPLDFVLLQWKTSGPHAIDQARAAAARLRAAGMEVIETNGGECGEQPQRSVGATRQVTLRYRSIRVGEKAFDRIDQARAHQFGLAAKGYRASVGYAGRSPLHAALIDRDQAEADQKPAG